MTAGMEGSTVASSTPGFTRLLLREPVAAGSIVFLLIVVLACMSASVISPYDPLAVDLRAVGQPPSAAHPFGLDTLGRDVLSRLLHGGVVSIIGVGQSLLAYVAIGVVFGITAGYAGGLIDRIINFVVEVVMSVPAIIVILAVVAIFDRSLSATMIALGVLGSAGLVRVVRAATMRVRKDLYVDAAKVAGLATHRILGRHILPRLGGPILISTSLFAGVALGVQTGLGFLGLGTPPPHPSWGAMVGEAATVIQRFPWLLVPSGGIIALCTIAFALIGDGARDALAAKSSHGALPAHRREPPGGTAPLDESVLLIQDLRVHFGQPNLPAVDGVTFSVGPSEIVGLVGESGSGKTVTVLASLGLLPNGAIVEDGRIWFGDVEVTSASYRTLASIRGSGIALVSQSPLTALDPNFKVRTHLIESLRVNRKLSRAAAKSEAVRLLAAVRMPNPKTILKLYPHQLSGGMAQRVAIAIALSGGPKVLIADEPTTALDVTVQAGVLEVLRTLREEQDMAILLVTHDLGVVADLCDRALVMKNGQIVESATTEELFASPKDEYTRQLIAATPSIVEMV